MTKSCKNCKWCSCQYYGYAKGACECWIEDIGYKTYPASKTEIRIEQNRQRIDKGGEMMKKSQKYIDISFAEKLGNFIYAGIDSNGSICHIEVPEIFREYASCIEEVILDIFCFKKTKSVPKWFIEYMGKRCIMHDFIYKYLNEFFSEITTESQLEDMIKKELIGMLQDDMSNISINIPDEIYQSYNKSASIKSYLYRWFEFALSDYKKRIDSVEL